MVVRFFSLLLVIALGAGLVLAQPQPSVWRQALRAELLSTKMTQGLAKFKQGGKQTLATATGGYNTDAVCPYAIASGTGLAKGQRTFRGTPQIHFLSPARCGRPVAGHAHRVSRPERR